MHLYDEPMQLKCLVCKRWWRPGQVACAVLHVGKGCCHYGDYEVPDPEEKRLQDLEDLLKDIAWNESEPW